MGKPTETNFAAKHSPEAKIDDAVQAAVAKRVSAGKMPCAVAFDIAGQLAVTPAEIGKTIDLLNIRLTKCQLGLFGYQPEKKIVTPAETIPPELEGLIRETVAGNRLSCLQAWEIAARLGLHKMVVSSACETLAIKIKPCQLGAF
jgi:hypothetical protein